MTKRRFGLELEGTQTKRNNIGNKRRKNIRKLWEPPRDP
jgi:hypothetical protein